MKHHYVLIFLAGLIILTYVLDSVVEPLAVPLASPYSYFTPQTMFTYPFTTTSIILKSIVVFIVPLLILSYIGLKKLVNGLILIVLLGFMQLYSLQSVLTHSNLISLEWSLSLALGGLFLLIPAIIYIIIGLTQKVHKKLTGSNEIDIENKEFSVDEE